MQEFGGQHTVGIDVKEPKVLTADALQGTTCPPIGIGDEFGAIHAGGVEVVVVVVESHMTTIDRQRLEGRPMCSQTVTVAKDGTLCGT